MIQRPRGRLLHAHTRTLPHINTLPPGMCLPPGMLYLLLAAQLVCLLLLRPSLSILVVILVRGGFRADEDQEDERRQEGRHL